MVRCRPCLELPPRARRIHHYKRYGLHWSGTTSACAENTPFERLELRLIWNYLRVRGEYPIGGILSGRPRELPPRARRIPAFKARWRCRLGTTSACAENTFVKGTPGAVFWNYLRVRGEYFFRCGTRPGFQELPPRARRIRCNHLIDAQFGVNYLRVRGEYPRARPPICTPLELPPRARRIPLGRSGNFRCPGTTSACAENTHPRNPRKSPLWNYLRVRGEYCSRCSRR